MRRSFAPWRSRLVALACATVLVLGSGAAHSWPATTSATQPPSTAAPGAGAGVPPARGRETTAPAPAFAPPLGAATAPPQPPPNPAPYGTAPAPPLAGAASPPRLDAAGTLEHARAAYEYGDIDEMVSAARQVADGQLQPTPAQRASALRYLGIGLFLTRRTEGAETAFFELLRLRPESRLDPQTTRPDVVAFFEQVRLRYAEPIRDAARANNRKVFAWNFLPPAGQIQNGHTARAVIIGGIEVVSLAAAITSFALLKSWQREDFTVSPDREDAARALRVVNWTSVGIFGAVFLYGIIDGIAHYGDPQDDAPTSSVPPARLSLTPSGLTLRF